MLTIFSSLGLLFAQNKSSHEYKTSLAMARETFSELKARKPDDWGLWFGLGKVQEKLGEHEEAFKQYQVAVDKSSSKLEPLHRLRSSKLKHLLRSYTGGDLTLEVRLGTLSSFLLLL